MMAVRIEKLLKRYLDELIDETLREFQWRASLDGRIPRYKLHNVAREDTVDCLVQVHGEDEAASTTVNIFLDMEQNNLADKLIQALLDRNTELEKQPVVSTVRPSQRDEFPIGSHDLSCTICLLLFSDPVVLRCGHSFCKICVHEEWSGKETWKCPLCQKVLPKTEPAINYNLRGLCETYREKSSAESCQTPSVSIREKQGSSEKGQQFSDPIVMYIKDWPLSTSISKKRKALEEGQQFFNQSVEMQGCDAAKRIKGDFKELHRLLGTMEEAKLAALEREKTNKVQSTFCEELLDFVEDNPENLQPSQINVSEHEELDFVEDNPENHEPSQINVLEDEELLQRTVYEELDFANYNFVEDRKFEFWIDDDDD